MAKRGGIVKLMLAVAVGPLLLLFSVGGIPAPASAASVPSSVPTTLQHTYPAGWNLISIPIDAIDPSPASILQGVPSPSVSAYARGHYFSPDEEGFFALEMGKAYWLLLTEESVVQVSGTVANPVAPYRISIEPGWNAIATPWPVALEWGDSRVSVVSGDTSLPLSRAIAAGWVSSFLWEYDSVSSTYTVRQPNRSPADTLKPWVGYLLSSTIHAELVLAPPAPENDFPVVTLIAPDDEGTVSFLGDVRGTANDANLLRYELALAELGDSTFVPFHIGDGPIADGFLGQLDATLQRNGVYRLRLTAEDLFGRMNSTEQLVRIQGEAKIGVVQLSFVDVQMPLLGIPLSVGRNYDSRMKTLGDFGYGWELDIREGKLRHNRKPGVGWQILRGDGLFGLPCTDIHETRSHFTEVRLSEREHYTFRLELHDSGATFGGCLAEARFAFVDGWIPGATLEILGNTTVVYQNGADEVLDVDSLEWFEVKDARLTTADNRVFDLNLSRGITRIQDQNGNFVTLSENGITHSTGTNVTFTRDGQGRITRISEPHGTEVRYQYDANGDLVSFTNQIGEVTRFEYSVRFPHHLVKMITPDGRVVTEFTYNSFGRLVGSCDADHNCTKAVHDLAGRKEIISDPTGRTTIYGYDLHGNVLNWTDALSNTTQYEYDTAGNLLRRTDPLGNVTRYTYDARRNLLSVEEPHRADEASADFTTSYSYDLSNRLTAAKLPTGSEIRMTYDASGNMLTLADEAGEKVLSYTYGANGVITRWQDPFGVETAAYDAGGNAIQATDVFGETSTMTYDSGGRLKTLTDPQGIVSTFSYDGLGRNTAADYGNGITASYGYGLGPDWLRLDAPTIGRIQKVTTVTGLLGGYVLPDGAQSFWTYDPAGRLVQERDPSGVVTSYGYDAAGRLETVTDAAGATTRVSFDAANRVTARTDALGNVTRYGYTEAGRLETLTDPLGRVWTFTYTPTAVTTHDPLGRAEKTELSGHGVPVGSTHADGTRSTVAYLTWDSMSDAEELPTRIVDEGGNVRTFAYDAWSRLISATDLGGNISQYTYNKDQLASITSPTGEEWSFTYDALDSLRTVTYPDGGIKTVDYGTNRLPSQVTLPSGATVAFQYDAAGRQTARIASSGERVSFNWAPGGTMTSMEDATGVTRYTYDARGSLAGITYPDGSRISYDYDALGRVATVRVQAGAAGSESTTHYAYDAVGNLIKVNDPLGGITTFAYDMVNRLVERVLPNGVQTRITYNNRDQVTSIVHLRSDGAVLASAAYERRGLGEPIKITYEDGSAVALQYDAAFRLTGETYYSATGALLDQVTYAYDAAGNRLSRSDTVGSNTYTYASGYRLTGVVGPGRDETYTFDTDGRVSAINRLGQRFELNHGTQDQLTEVLDTTTGARLEYVYDGAGRRVRAVGGTGQRAFLVAPTNDGGLESTHLVTDQSGLVLSQYVYTGEVPLMRLDPSGPVYYLTDAMGSVLGLVDGSGDRVARFEYDAFGNLRNSSGPGAQAPGPIGGDFRFQGAWLEAATELYHVRARNYDPKTGRFLSRDPADVNEFQPETLHPYVFANNNPHAYRDPTGEFTLIDFNFSTMAQGGLRQIGINQLKQYSLGRIKDEIAEKATRYLYKQIQAFLPGKWVATLLDDFNYSTQGLFFENPIKDLLCGIIQPMPLGSDFYFEPQIERNGTPRHNGLNCDEHYSGRDWPFLGIPRPDFVLTPTPIMKVKKGEGKAYFIGDIKRTARTVERRIDSNQGWAMSNFSIKHAYRTVVYVAWKKCYTPYTEAKIRATVLDRGYIILLAIIDEKSSC